MTETELLKDNQKAKIFAVSGGPDSMYLLDQYRQQLDPRTIIVAHVNYNFRDDSMIDQELVEKYCQKYNLKLVIKTVEKMVYQNLKQNFEDFAREVRYNFFTNLAHEYQTNVVFVAHNKNDLVETYLLQLARKNLVNYYGLTKITAWKDIWIYRPLLDLNKSYLLEQNNLNQTPYHLDQTNLDQRYARNKLRQTLSDDHLDEYVKEINKKNQQLNQERIASQNYLQTNVANKELTIQDSFFAFNEVVKKRILYSYFYQINPNLLVNRKKQTLTEILKLVENQEKPILIFKIKGQVIVKDFDKLYIVNQDFFTNKTFVLKSWDDLNQIQNLDHRLEIKTLILEDQEKWPYQLTNDYEDYKNWSFVKTKKTNRYFIDQKVSLKSRVLAFALINKDNQFINVKSFF